MVKYISGLIAAVVIAFVVIVRCCTPIPTFESIVDNDYNYIITTYGDSSCFFEARAYMPERVDSSALHQSQIDSLVTIFAVYGNSKVISINHKIKGTKVITDTTYYRGPFVEDCIMPWPLPITFKQMMNTVAANNLVAPNKDIALRRALILNPKDYPDFTIYGGENKWWFISSLDGSIRDKQ